MDSEPLKDVTQPRCTICDNRTLMGDFCQPCWEAYQEDILAKPPWIMEMKRSIQRERRYINRGILSLEGTYGR